MMKQLSLKRRGQRRPARAMRLETLEGRSMLAGNVSVIVGTGVVELRGDAAANQIEIEADPFTPGLFTVQGLPGTTVNGSPLQQSFQTGRDLRIRLAAGNDEVIFNGNGGTLPGHLFVDLGVGDNQFNLTGDYTVAGKVSYVAGNGRDLVTISDLVARDIALSTGNGGENISLTNVTTTVPAANSITVLTGTATLASPHELSIVDTSASRSLQIRHGAGNSTTAIDGTNVAGQLMLITGNGTANIALGATTPVNTTGDLAIVTATGAANLTIDGGTASNASIRTLSGVATIDIDGLNVDRSLLITNGAGNDSVTIANATIALDLSLQQAIGNHSVTIDNTFVGRSGRLLTQGGNQIVSIGPTGPVTVQGGGFDIRNGIIGNMDLSVSNLSTQGNFSVQTGRGMHTVEIGGAGPVAVGRALLVRSDGGAQVSIDDAIVGLDLSVVLGNAVGMHQVYIGQNAPVQVARIALVQTRFGAADIHLAALEVGTNLVVQTSSGPLNLRLEGSAAGDLVVHGVTGIDTGIADDTVTIGVNGNAVFNGRFTFLASTGNDDVTVGALTSGAVWGTTQFVFDGGFGIDVLTVSPAVFNVQTALAQGRIRNFTNVFAV